MQGNIARGTARPTPTLKLTRTKPFIRKYGGDVGGGGQEFEGRRTESVRGALVVRSWQAVGVWLRVRWLGTATDVSAAARSRRFVRDNQIRCIAWNSPEQAPSTMSIHQLARNVRAVCEST